MKTNTPLKLYKISELSEKEWVSIMTIRRHSDEYIAVSISYWKRTGVRYLDRNDSAIFKLGLSKIGM